MIYIHSLTHSFILEGFAEPQPKYAEQDYKDGKHGPSLHTPHRIVRETLLPADKGRMVW